MFPRTVGEPPGFDPLILTNGNDSIALRAHDVGAVRPLEPPGWPRKYSVSLSMG